MINEKKQIPKDLKKLGFKLTGSTFETKPFKAYNFVFTRNNVEITLDMKNQKYNVVGEVDDEVKAIIERAMKLAKEVNKELENDK